VSLVLYRLKSLWNRLTIPRVEIEDRGRLYQSRLLSSLFLIIFVVLLLLTLLGAISAAFQPETDLQLQNRFVAVVIAIIAYVLSRHGLNEWSLGWMTSAYSILLCLQTVLIGGMLGLSSIYYLGIITFLCGLFASARTTFLVILIQFIAVLLIPAIPDDNITLDMLRAPLVFLALMGLFTLAGFYYRNRLDDEKNAQILETESRYRNLVEGLEDILYTIAPDGKILSVNPAAQRILGHKPADLVDRTFFPFIHPDDRETIRSTISLGIASFTTPTIEVRVLNATGTYLWIETSMTPQLHQGRLVSITGFARDISSRKQAEEALRQSEQRLSMLVQQIPLAVIEWDTNHHVASWNPAAERIFGYSAAEAIGKYSLELLVPENAQMHVHAVFDRLITQKTFTYSVNDNRTKDGRIITVEWFNIPIFDNNDVMVGTAAICNDITDRQQADEQRLKLALFQERMSVLKRFMDAVAHDFRTSLTQIETSRYLLENALPSEIVAIANRRLQNITASVQHMNTQLGNLSAISALTELQLITCDLNRLVREIAYARQPAVYAAGITLQLNLASGILPSLVDEDRLQSALIHLLNNAITYTPPGGQVTLRTRTHEHTNYIDVIDTGIGIDPQYQSVIFDLFYRLDDARSLNTGGVGLGLSIARLVAEAHGGSITVVSTLGQGSTFTLSLPAVDTIPALNVS